MECRGADLIGNYLNPDQFAPGRRRSRKRA
jgi:hypothetical protein